MALASWAIATLVQRATGSIAGGVVAAALLMLNPNVLYLQSTPMTEPLLFGTTFLAVALIAQWSSAEGKSSRAAGWACIAAVLTRYEAWPIVATAIGLAFVVLLLRGFTLAAALRAVRGLALWPLWAIAAYLVNSKVTVGAWFVSTGFFTPDNPAQGHPWLAWTQIWEGLVRLTGPVLPWAAVASALALVASALTRNPVPPEEGRSRSAALLIVLALAASAALPWSAYV